MKLKQHKLIVNLYIKKIFVCTCLCVCFYLTSSSQSFTFEKDLRSLVKLNKSTVYEEMQNRGYTLENTQEDEPSKGYNKIYFYKKIDLKEKRDYRLFDYSNYDSYSFTFKTGNENEIKIITFTSSNKKSLMQIKASFLRTFLKQNFTTETSNDCFEQKSQGFLIHNLECSITFVDCSFIQPNSSGKWLKTYACDLYINIDR